MAVRNTSCVYVHSWNTGDNFHECGHEPLPPDEGRITRWLTPVQQVLFDLNLEKDIRQLTKACKPGDLEAYHSMPSTTYDPISTSNQINSDNNDVGNNNDDETSIVSDCCQLHNEVLIEIHHEDDNDSLLSDTTSSLIRFMDEMDNDSFTDVSSITTDNEDGDDTFTTVTDY